PFCSGHNEPCALRTVRKEGPNQGREFYCCARAQGEQCEHFKWTDEEPSSGGPSFRGPTRGGGGGDGRVCNGHQEPCALRTVRKEGANQGREFYCCARPQGDQCDHFDWADE
ncbi:unnamed protein product, partial [Discosporangium mesarthrocarpum]